MATRPKLLFVITEDWYFWSHRLPIARAALQSGFDVLVASHVTCYGQQITDAGFRLIPLQLSRSSYSPLAELRSVRQLKALYESEQPQIVHHVALKPVLYGSTASWGRKQMQVINAFAGLGYLAASQSMKAKLLRPAIWNTLRFLLNRPHHHLLLQNEDDRELFIRNISLPAEKITVIRGSGVNVAVFHPTPEPDGIPVVVLASRMLWIKGIQQFVEAAKLLREKCIPVRFVLVGEGDPKSPSCVPHRQLLEWEASGIVEYWGHHRDMTQVFERANLVCLPSHGGEGVPKVLMEAAASGRAIVTTAVPGCREIVQEGFNGLLVEPKNAVALAAAVEKLLQDRPLRIRMAACGRQIAVKEFSEEIVIQETLELYGRLLGAGAGEALTY